MNTGNIEIYRATGKRGPVTGEWRWRMTHRNTKLIGGSTEGYKNRAAAIKNLEAVTGFILKIVPNRKGNSFTAYNVNKNDRGKVITV